MWWQNYAPDRVFLDLGPIKIYWYGLLVALGLGLAIGVIIRQAVKKNYDLEKIYNLLFWLIIFGLIGARVWEVFVYSWSYFKANPESVLKLWQGGLAIHGALIAGLMVIAIWCYKNKEIFWKYLDLLLLALPLGQAVGRWGNYFNQELFGRATTSGWGIFIAPENRPVEYFTQTTFLPVFFFESILNLILFGLLLFLAKKEWVPGIISAGYLIGYGLIRFMVEFVRIDPVGSVLGLRWPQWISLGLVVIGTWILLSKKKESATISQLSSN